MEVVSAASDWWRPGPLPHSFVAVAWARKEERHVSSFAMLLASAREEGGRETVPTTFARRTLFASGHRKKSSQIKEGGGENIDNAKELRCPPASCSRGEDSAA
jgi:hypothetical protein